MKPVLHFLKLFFLIVLVELIFDFFIWEQQKAIIRYVAPNLLLALMLQFIMPRWQKNKKKNLFG